MPALAAIPTLPYLGGKSAAATSGLGRWVAEKLPRRTAYAEAFGGMLGVLVSRPKSSLEIVNDLDGLIWAWWTAVRDHGDELHRRLSATPYAEQSVSEAAAMVAAWREQGADEPDVLDAAWAVAVMCGQTIGRRLSLADGVNFRTATFRADGGHTNPARSWRNTIAVVPALTERLAEVHLERRDAARFIERVSGMEDLVLYVDPPYRAPHMPRMGRRYYDYDVDGGALVDALVPAKAAVAVSGYPGDRWEGPLESAGWQRHERVVSAHTGTQDSTRTEVLWTNYSAPCQPRMIF